VTGANEPKTLTALCFVSNLTVERGFSLKGPFSKMWEELERRDQPSRQTFCFRVEGGEEVEGEKEEGEIGL
jgi:hypothetical protein